MKVFLNTGGQYINDACWLWVSPFKKLIESRGFEVVETDISRKEERESIKKHYEQGDFFITRFSEHWFPVWVAHYNEIAPLFGDRIFPNSSEVYYYNDKERQRKLFEEKGYPHPKTIYAKSAEDISLPFPLVRKKAGGSSSIFVSLETSEKGIEFPCLLQEFCDGNDGDIRINVIGNYVTGYKRFNRDNDFRASGSHKNCYLGPCLDELPLECMSIASKISEDNNFNCMCYDFVKNSREEWVVLELSYTFVPSFVNACEYKYDSANNFEKVDNDCSVQELVVRRILK